MKVTTKIKKIDLILLNLAVLPKMKSTYTSLLVLIILIFGFLCWHKGFPETSRDWIAISVGSIVGGIGGKLFGIVYSIFSILLMSSKKNGILGVHEYEITLEGLHEKTSANEGLSKWEGIEEVRIAGSYVLFKISGFLFHIIPSRSFDSPEHFNQFIVYSKKCWEETHKTKTSL